MPLGMRPDSATAFNFGTFSSRTGNIYTTSLLEQWLRWACKAEPSPDEVWRNEDRFIDPFRPRIEPGGFESADELHASRERAINCLRNSIESAGILIFTLGLTESWFHGLEGFEYPMCPGTAGGVFDAGVHKFVNQGYQGVVDGLQGSIRLMRSLNPKLKVILTVSPVPLTATCSTDHVLVSTMRSKSILRAAAAHVCEPDPRTDYFPSYEIINSPVFEGRFFEKNLRSVSPDGVKFVMNHFFSGIGETSEVTDPAASISTPREVISHGEVGINTHSRDDINCDEEILAAWSPSTAGQG